MIINRSFIIEVIRTALAVTVVVLTLFLVLRVMGFLSQAAEGLIPVSGVLSLVGLKMIAYLDVMLPLMFYIALIMVLNQWHSDGAMVVLASVGIGISHFLKPLSLMVLLLGGLVAFCALYLTPLVLATGYTLEQEYRQNNEISGVITGKFIQDKDGEGVYFVETYDRESGYYQNVFVYKSSFEREGVVVAKNAYLSEDEASQEQFLILLNGSRYEGNPGSPDYRVINFEKYALRIEPKKRNQLHLPIRALANAELQNSSDPKKLSEWYWRVAKVFTLPILAIFALALSHVDSRRGKATGTALAFLVYLTYTNFLAYAVALVKKGVYSDGTIIWAVHLSYAMLAIYCLYRRNYNLSLLPQLGATQVS